MFETNRIGYGEWDQLHAAIMRERLFRHDYFIKVCGYVIFACFMS